MSLFLEKISIEKPSYLGRDNWELKNLNEITIIFGKNGSGKSLLLKSLLNQKNDSRHLTSPERAGNFQNNPDLANQESLASTRASQKQSNLSLDFRQRVISRINTLLTKRGFYLDGSEEEFSIENIEDAIKQLIPDFNFKITSTVPFFELKRIIDDENVSDKDQMSSGEAEIISVGLDVLTICEIWKLEKNEERILLIDEPDTHLHPDLQQRLASFIVDISKNYDTQIIIATHSTTLLSALGFYGKEKTSIIYLNPAQKEHIAIKFEKNLQELSTCLGGHALMGPLFNKPLLLVEGDDDYNIWSQVPRHGIVGISVIPCNGEEIFDYQKILEKLFNSLLDQSIKPSGFALIDNDKVLPAPDTTSQNHINFIKLNCHESENLYLSDEVLSEIGITWDYAKELIKSKANNHGNKEKFLLGCDDWDRKNGDFHNYIKEISFMIDPKNVSWTKRVGTTIGKNKPTGQLLDFLGENTVKCLWEGLVT